MSEVHVTGLADLQKFLDQLPVKVEMNVMRGALRAGAKLIKDDAVARCPVGKPSAEGARLYGGYAGALRDSIRLSARRKGSVLSVSVKAGGKTRQGADVWYAHLIEFTGAVAHIIRSTNRKALSFGKAGGVFRSVLHPGMKAKPFLRPALDAQASNAVVAAAEYMKKRLATKQGLDTSEVQIGVDE